MATLDAARSLGAGSGSGGEFSRIASGEGGRCEKVNAGVNVGFARPGGAPNDLALLWMF